MGIMAMLMLTLSMLQSMNATKQSPMIVHLRFQPLVFVAACCDNNDMFQTPKFMILCCLQSLRPGLFELMAKFE